MKYQILLTPDANNDLVNAISWYDEQKKSLSIKFYNEVALAIDLIGSHPHLFAIRKKSIRLVPVKHFPFSIYYKFEKRNKRVIVLAILHQSRNPQIWDDRIG
jgi:plasmid stabilization system protein ParE